MRQCPHEELIGPAAPIRAVLLGKEPRLLRKQWKRVAKILMGSAFVFFFGPEECWFFYCDRHSFEPPICSEVIVT